MKNYDYLIVGQGLAGTALAFRLIQENKKVLLVDSVAKSAASFVAPGMYNPMVLKRFTKCWNVEKQLPYMYEFLDAFEDKFNVHIHERLPLYRILHSVEEQNLWYEASDKKSLSDYMSEEIKSYKQDGIISNFGLGKVNHAGRVHIAKMLESFRAYLISNDIFLNEDFSHADLYSTENGFTYKDYTFEKIVFCEGYGILQNPMFSYLPLLGTKGELIEIYAPELKLTKLLKGSVFILPLGEDKYRVGATFNWKDKSIEHTEEAKQELQKKLETIITVPYKVINQTAGIRPTVKDRRPLMGRHPENENMYVFNGLGTRGVLISAYLTKQMYDFLETDSELDPECDISRYDKLYHSNSN